MEYKYSEETRAKWREDYQKNRDKLLPIKNERRKRMYKENRLVELSKAKDYYKEHKEVMSLKSLIRYYQKKGDTTKVNQLNMLLIGILEGNLGGVEDTPTEE